MHVLALDHLAVAAVYAVDCGTEGGAFLFHGDGVAIQVIFRSEDIDGKGSVVSP